MSSPAPGNVELDEESRVILSCIHQGINDTQQIKEETTLTRRQIKYRFNKLEDADLIATRQPEGYTERVIDGQKRVFRHPREAELTDDGIHFVAEHDSELEAYRDMTREELVMKVHRLEEEINQLKDAFETFRRQVLTKIND